MLRLIGFFLIVFVALGVLRTLPVVGGIFAIPLFGFYLAAILVSVVGARLAKAAADRMKQKQLERELGGVDTPYNRGKLGLLMLQQGRAKLAVPHLEAALEADPSSDEFTYRLGLALLATGDLPGSIEMLERLTGRNEEHAYGGALLALARAQGAYGDGQGSLGTLDRHDRAFGPVPESAYWRGRVLRALGDRAAAAASFAAVGAIAADQPAYQRRAAATWRLRAQLARLGF